MAQKAQERAHAAAVRERARQERESLRRQQADAVQQREAEVAELNQNLEARYRALQTILETGLARQPGIEFDSLKDKTPYPRFAVPPHISEPTPEPSPEAFAPAPLTFFGKLFGKQKHARAVVCGSHAYRDACIEREQAERERLNELDQLTADHERGDHKHAERLSRQHAEVDEFERQYRCGEPSAISSYCELVLTASPHPEACPGGFRLAYVPDSKQVVVNYQLPTFDAIPEESNFRYIKARDEITFAAAKVLERKSLYAEVVSGITIRTMHELFAADAEQHIEVVVFNGYVRTTDPGTGSDIQPFLVTARATRDEMAGMDLRRVDPIACLRHLKAQLSRNPSELQPVRPIVDFNMVDPRFVEHGNILAELDQRPNLMEMTPGEFETLVTNLFETMGLETKLTQASRDGGVDCVAYDQRPVLGGKVVIQAKRYKHTVGVSAVRDLFGTMHNEGANKGILVTTSHYGQAAYDFANGKPIELIDGANLLYLLSEQGVEAKIEMPDDWQDPALDS